MACGTINANFDCQAALHSQRGGHERAGCADRGFRVREGRLARVLPAQLLHRRPRASGQCTHYGGNFVIQIKIEDGFARDATWAVWARKREVQNDPLEAEGVQKTKRRQPDTVPGFCVVRAKKDPRFLDGVMVGVVDGTIVRLQDCMTRASKTYVLRQFEGHVSDPKSVQACRYV